MLIENFYLSDIIENKWIKTFKPKKKISFK